MKKSVFFAIIVMVISLSSCKKEDNSGMIKDGPSPSLAKKGTIVPDSVTCVEEVNQFVGLFKAFRAKQHPSIPVYYDRHLIDLMSGESGITSSVANTINSEYYVIDKGEKKMGRFVPFTCTLTIESPEAMFKKIESNPEAYEEFTGNMKGTRFFSEYDIFGVNLKKYTDGCLAGKYKMTLIVWVGTSPLTSY